MQPVTPTPAPIETQIAALSFAPTSIPGANVTDRALAPPASNVLATIRRLSGGMLYLAANAGISSVANSLIFSSLKPGLQLRLSSFISVMRSRTASSVISAVRISVCDFADARFHRSGSSFVRTTRTNNGTVEQHPLFVVENSCTRQGTELHFRKDLGQPHQVMPFPTRATQRWGD
jgi:hypothetical protein